MNKPLVFSAVAAGLVLAYTAKQQADAQAENESGSDGGGVGDAVLSGFVRVSEDLGFMPFTIAKNLAANKTYVTYIRGVETALGIPRDLLVRLAYQESRFRADIITGKTISSAGAKGMFQLMPVHWSKVDPLNWKASADYAGRFLVQLFKQFGTWQMALAAYNWGPGNLKKYGIAKAPKETRNYYTQILADVGSGLVVA